MLIKLLVLNKRKDSVVVKKSYGDVYEYLHGDDLYMESPDKAVSRIARDAISITLDDSKLSLVRRESTTVVSNGTCDVISLATYIYICESDSIELSPTDYMWVSINDVVKSMCDNGMFFEVAYLMEACGVV